MRARFLLLPFLALALAPVPFTGADTPTPPALPEIRLPEVVDAPRPPAPTITKLSAAELYVIDSDVELLVLASPEGVVSVTPETGPMKVRAVFAGNTKTTTRNIKGPRLYFVEAAQTGRVELLITRTDGKGKLIRRTLDVTVEPGPVPPGPGPGPNPPGPNPPGPGPTPEPLTSFRVIFVYESGDSLTAAQRGIVYGKAVEDFLTANCTGGKSGWRRRDKDAPGENDATMKALWEAVQPKVTVTPCVAIERNGKVEIVNLEATPAAMIEKLKTYRGK